jgi:hypothetical protein
MGLFIEHCRDFFNQQRLVLPQDLDGVVELYSYKHFVFCTRQWFIRIKNLEQAGFKADYVILAYYSVKLHAEYVINFYFAKIRMGVIPASGRAAEFSVHLRQVCFRQKFVGVLDCADILQAQLLYKPVLIYPMIAFNPPFGLRAVGGYYFNAQPVASLPEMAFRPDYAG